jgi:hypothetical protein
MTYKKDPVERHKIRYTELNNRDVIHELRNEVDLSCTRFLNSKNNFRFILKNELQILFSSI